MDKKEQLKRMREEKISSKEVYKGIILDIFVDQVRLPSGNTSQREVIRHCHAAAVLAIDENNRVLLEDQFRYPYDDIITEIPAGKGDEGEDYQITLPNYELKNFLSILTLNVKNQPKKRK